MNSHTCEIDMEKAEMVCKLFNEQIRNPKNDQLKAKIARV
jgi:hypothetical protein